jgi:type I restriction enzyme, S subunit
VVVTTVNDWKSKSLDELGFVGRGKSKHRPRDAAHLYGGPYPFIQTGDVKHSNLYVNKSIQTYSEAGLAQSRLWKSGTLCITIAANIADTAILGIDACFPDSVIGFVPDEEKADVKFVKYLFNTLQSRYQQYSQGAAQDNLSQKKLLSLKFLVPKLSIQKKIVHTLSAYDDLIENNLRRIALLEKSARLLYEEWFVRLRFPGYERVKIKDGVPDGWSFEAIGELANVTMGQSPPSEFYNEDGQGLPFHQGVTNFGHTFVSHAKYCTAQRRIAEGGDILCSVRAPVGRINLTLDKIVIGRGLAAFRSRMGFQSFLFYQMKNYFFKEDIIGAGAIFASVTKKDLLNQLILTPTIELAKTFQNFTISIDYQIRNLFVQNQKLKQARDLLLPKLMNGEIIV